jgi:nicotinamidase/pyrazinamidase
MKKLLFVIDVQNDFLPGGALPVPDGDDIFQAINKHLSSGNFSNILFSYDDHEEDDMSFAVNNGVEPFTVLDGEIKWPVHCVKFTDGWMTSDKIENVNNYDKFGKSGYSAVECEFLPNFITLLQIEEVTVCGLATDYCVFHTAMDLKKHTKAKIIVDLNGCRGVSLDSTEEAIKKMKEAGIEVIGEIL